MNWWFLLLWLVAVAGMAKLLAMGENVLHGRGWRRQVLQTVRTCHNVLLFGYPLSLLIYPGWLGSGLIWSDATLSEMGLSLWPLIPGWIGFGSLMASTVRHWTYRPPRCQTASKSHVRHFAAQNPESLIGPGRARWLARLPGNEQFSLEVQERTYHLPRLPAEWDGVSIVHFSDVHFRGPVAREYFEHVFQAVQELQADLVVFTGDLLDHKSCLSWIPSTLGQVQAPLGCYFILGNHDWYLGIEEQTRAALRDHGWIDVGSRVHRLERGGIPLVIAGNEQPWLGSLPELADFPADGFRVLLSHSPDQIDWARQQPVDLMLAGHTHGGQIRLPVLGPVYSPSIYSCRYASGVFQVGPTLMSVTRGVSGREPIRYFCRPEITKLTLHRQHKP